MLRMFCVALFVLAGWPAAGAPCQARHTIASGDSLDGLSEFYFGDGKYASAILLATNARAGEQGFQYIGTPDALPAGKHLCIPDLQEAERLRLRYETYQKAIEDMILPEPAEVSDKLLAIDGKKPARVLSWMRPDEVQTMKETGGAWKTKAPKDIWVTLVPYVKSFCQEFSKAHGDHLGQLVLRLEQRLGMPPGSSKAAFLEITVLDPSSIANIFRPCSNPSVTTATCPAGPPAATAPQSYRTWFFTQYYNSYATARPSQYPWTSLGYTFDWASRAPEMGGSGFAKYGESEFVVPKGGSIRVESISETGRYCAAE
jgi:hypothetical protein